MAIGPIKRKRRFPAPKGAELKLEKPFNIKAQGLKAALTEDLSPLKGPLTESTEINPGNAMKVRAAMRAVRRKRRGEK